MSECLSLSSSMEQGLPIGSVWAFHGFYEAAERANTIRTQHTHHHHTPGHRLQGSPMPSPSAKLDFPCWSSAAARGGVPQNGSALSRRIISPPAASQQCWGLYSLSTAAQPPIRTSRDIYGNSVSLSLLHLVFALVKWLNCVLLF